jgi:hypothetical protein
VKYILKSFELNFMVVRLQEIGGKDYDSYRSVEVLGRSICYEPKCINRRPTPTNADHLSRCHFFGTQTWKITPLGLKKTLSFNTQGLG